MKYLLDSLQRYETNHSDALCPVQNEYDKSFMGDHKLLEQPTNQDLQLFSAAMTSTINLLAAMILQLPSRAPAVTSNHHLTHNPSASQPHQCWCRYQSQSGQLPPSSEDNHSSGLAPATGQPAGPVRSQRLHNPSTIPGYQGKSKKQPVPLPDMIIKNICRGPDAWLEAAEQWDTELKSWEAQMFTGPM